MADFYIQQGVSGGFLAPLEFTNECFSINARTVQKLSEAQIPIVLSDADYTEFPDRSGLDLIGIDNFRAGYTLAEHFIRQGAVRVDFVQPPYSAQTVPQRARGTQAALLEHGIVPQSAWIHTGEPSDPAFVKKVLDSGATNIVSSNDVTAVHVIQQLDRLNVKVPADVRIVGVDDVKYSHFVRISLTTIRQPCQVMGQVAVRTMLERIQSPILPTRQLLLGAELIVRESSQIP
ncbi:MAG: LacI family transcriptional regulator [bacterium]|nr:LacI family transcriptional regulator [bacterium]